MNARLMVVIVALACLGLVACDEPLPAGPSQPPLPPIADDAALFKLATETQSYTTFPNAEVMTSGRLTGSTAHAPSVRVRLNGVARSVLQGGELPRQARFPDGSILLKEIFGGPGGALSLYSVMYKATNDSRAGNGWLWAEFTPSGTVHQSIARRGASCTSCHQLVRGLLNDSVRTFERQE
jgi:hypothetical protein